MACRGAAVVRILPMNGLTGALGYALDLDEERFPYRPMRSIT